MVEEDFERASPSEIIPAACRMPVAMESLNTEVISLESAESLGMIRMTLDL